MAYADTTGFNAPSRGSYLFRAGKWAENLFVRMIEARQRAALIRIAPYLVNSSVTRR